MSGSFSTNELLLRSDRIAFGKIPPEVPSNQERTLILPDTTGQYLFFGLSSMVSTNAVQGTLEALYPSLASFSFDNTNKRLGINVSSPAYALDIQTTTGVRISGGTLIASGTGLFSIPTAALFSTLPTSVFAPGTIPANAFLSSGSLAGLSVPTSALFSTLPTALFASGSIPLSALQSSGTLRASSFVGDGFFLSNIPLANINGSITGSFFQPNTIPLSSIASTGQIWIRNAEGAIFVPLLSTGQLFTSSFNANTISTRQAFVSSLEAVNFASGNFSASNLSAINLKASSIEVLHSISSGRFSGDGQFITNLTPSYLNSVIPADKFGYRLIAFDAINPYGDFLVEAGTAQFKVGTTTSILGFFNVSSIRGDGSQLYNLNTISSPSLVSTVAGLGTAGYLSSGAIGVITDNLVSSLVGLATLGYISTSQLMSSFGGLGTLGYISSLSLLSTAASLESGYKTSGFLSSQNLLSSVQGLGSAGYVSTLSLVSTTLALDTRFATAGFLSSASLRSSVEGLGSSGYISTSQLLSSVAGITFSATSSLQLGDLRSSVEGLGSSGYVSTLSLVSSVNNSISSFSTALGPGGTNLTTLISTLDGLGTLGYVSTQSLVSSVNDSISSFSTALGPGGTNLTTLISTLDGLGTLGYVSTQSLISSVNDSISSFSTALGPGGTNLTTLISTLDGLGTLGYVSTLSLISTTYELELQLTSYVTQKTFDLSLTSTIAGLGSSDYISSLSLFSSVNNSISSFSTALGPVGAGTLTTANLVSSIQGLGSAGYVSTLSLFSSVNNSISSFSTALGPVGAGTLTTANLVSSIQGLGSAGYVSTLSLFSSVNNSISSFSTALGPVGSGSLTTANLVSSITGLGTTGYVSTLSLTSSIIGLGTRGYVSTATLGASISTLSTSYRNAFNTVTSVISALTVSSLTFGSGDGFLAMPDIRPLSMSTQVTQTSSLQAFNLQIGATSSVTAIQFYGLQGNFNNTVLAERQIGTGTQEFLIFKGSSTQDQVRIQTTGIFEVETGVSARLWSTTTQLAVPAFLIDINSNVGIQTAAPGATLDVNGSIRSQSLSTLLLNFSSLGRFQVNALAISTGNASASTFTLLDPYTTALNYLTVSSGTLLLNGAAISGGGGGGGGVTQIIAGNNISISPIGGTGIVTITATSPSVAELTSTSIGLGSLGYVSSQSLRSTTLALQTQYLTSGYLSTPNLLSSVTGLGTSGYVSSQSLQSTTLALQTQYLTSGYLSTPNLLSSITGLGSSGYVSSQSLQSTTLAIRTELLTAGYLSTPNLLSSIAGLGSSDYVSSLSLYSTMSNWSFYQATSSVVLENANPTIIVPNTILTFKDTLDTSAVLKLGQVTFQENIVTNESYTIGNSQFITGNLSTLGLLYSDNTLMGPRTASLYMSSLYFGNLGAFTYGELTTDAATKNVYWKGDQLQTLSGPTTVVLCEF